MDSLSARHQKYLALTSGLTGRQKLVFYAHETYWLARFSHCRTHQFIRIFSRIALKMDDEEMEEWYDHCYEETDDDPRCDLFYDWDGWEYYEENELRHPNITDAEHELNQNIEMKLIDMIELLKEYDDDYVDHKYKDEEYDVAEITGIRF